MSTIEFQDEEDFSVESITAEQLNEIVVFSSDWTTETIVSQLKKKAIDINPLFQRRDAWSREKKSRYIESLILGMPVPQIVLAELKKGSYSVLDGKQRLLTLLQFFGLSEDKKTKFKLSGCDIKPELNGKNIDDFQGNGDFIDINNALSNQTIRSVIIRNCRNPRILEKIFIRLNTASVQLSPHELRLARFPGQFMNFIDAQSYESSNLHRLLGTEGADFRMRDSELLTRFFAFYFFMDQYSGDMSGFMDDGTETLNKNWAERESEIQDAMQNFENGCNTLFNIFAENACHKWIGFGYEKKFNRAVFDALMYYFSNPEICKKTNGKETEIEQAFKKMCEESQEFKDAIGTTTKKLKSVYDRIYIWGEYLSKAIGESLPLPRLEDRKICK